MPDQPKTKRMWAVRHKPSGSWDRGDTTLTLYPFDYDARLAAGDPEYWEPVEVLVTEVPRTEEERS